MDKQGTTNGPLPNKGNNATQHPVIPKSNVVWLWLYGIAFLTCFTFGGAYFNNHPKPNKIAWSALFFGFFFLGLTIRRGLLNYRTKHPIRKGWPTGLGVAFIILTGIACLFGYCSEEREVITDYYVSVEPTSHSPSLNPFDTFLTVKNISPRPIYNVGFGAWWREPSGFARYGVFDFHSHIIVPKLDPNVPQDWKINSTEGAPHSVEEQTEFFVAISFSTNPNSSTFLTNLFRFQIFNMNGQAVWAHEGEGKTYGDVWDMAAPPTNQNARQEWQTVMPALAIIDFTFSQTNKDLAQGPTAALQIHCVVTNGGGVMATNVTVRWQFVSFLGVMFDSTRADPPNYLPYRVLPKGAMPDNLTVLDTPPSGHTNSFRDLVRLGTVRMIGTVTYNDQWGHDYRVTVEALPENDNFTIHPLQFLAPFSLLKTNVSRP